MFAVRLYQHVPQHCSCKKQALFQISWAFIAGVKFYTLKAFNIES